MKKILPLFSVVLVLAFAIACDNEAPKEEKFSTELDFASYALDLKLKGPDDAVIEKKEDSMFPHEYEINGTDYMIEIIGQKATEADRRVIKQQALAEVKKNPSFEVTVPVEDDFGFVYGKKFPGDTTQYYNFYYVVLDGDMQFLFNTNGTRKFSVEQVTDMYEAVKQE